MQKSLIRSLQLRCRRLTLGESVACVCTRSLTRAPCDLPIPRSVGLRAREYAPQLRFNAVDPHRVELHINKNGQINDYCPQGAKHNGEFEQIHLVSVHVPQTSDKSEKTFFDLPRTTGQE